MAIVDRRELSAKPEVKKAIARVRRALRSALSGGSFGEREVEVSSRPRRDVRPRRRRARIRPALANALLFPSGPGGEESDLP